jgi:alpha-tubulin suppressor-like RCC1 family protein
MNTSLRAGHLLLACAVATLPPAAGCGDPTGASGSGTLAFAVEPAATMVGEVMAPAVEVVILDRHGNRVSGATDLVTLTVGENPNDGQLLGTVARTAVDGVAAFPGLHIDRAGVGYTLRASAARLAEAESGTFDVVGFVSLSAGSAFTCGHATGDRALCWGDNWFGTLGNGTTASSSHPVPVADDLSLVALTAGVVHACGLTPAGTAYCWGSHSPSPSQVAGGHRWLSLSAGSFFTCGITSGGQAYCWGSNEYGQLGNGSTDGSSIPTLVAGGLTFVHVSAGEEAACGITSGNVAYCWGLDDEGLLGVGGSAQLPLCDGWRCSPTPIAVAGGLQLVTVSVGGHACGLSADGAAYCWGENGQGELGDSALSVEPYPCNGPCSRTPVRVAGGMTFSSVSAGHAHTCGVATTGVPYCWGDNHFGQLGTGGANDRNAPAAVYGSGLVYAAVTAGFWHTCGLTTAGKAYCWGDNGSGELGDGSRRLSRVPRPVSNPGVP